MGAGGTATEYLRNVFLRSPIEMRQPVILIVLASTAVALSACDSPDEPPIGSETPSTASPLSPASPSQSLQPVATPELLDNVRNVTEPGFYVLEPATASLWRVGPSQGASGAWSADGRFFVRFGQGQQDADVVDLAAGSARRVFSGAFWHFSWSPDGSHMAFTTGDGLFTVQRDGTDLRLAAAIDGTAGMGWSPRGDLIASAERYAVRITGVSTGETRVVSPEVGADDLLGFMAWLPDGNRLLFCSSQATDATLSRLSPGTYIYDLTSESARKLADNCGVSVSPDGSSYTFSDSTGIFTASIDASQPPNLLAAGGASGAWSADGTWFAFAKDGCLTDDYDIYAVRSEGGAIVRLTDSPHVLKESAGWSPVANQIAYSALLEDSQGLLLLDANTMELRTLLTSTRDFHIHGPRWSPDGRYISFSGGGGHGAC